MPRLRVAFGSRKIGGRMFFICLGSITQGRVEPFGLGWVAASYPCVSIGNAPMCCRSLRVVGRQGDSLPVARDATPTNAPWYVPCIKI